MTKKDIDNIISIICPNDEDFEKLIISPAYLKKELEVLALDQEPCEDAISRQAVLEKAVYTETEEGWWGYTVDVDYIKSLPPVTPQPNIGHWIDDGFYAEGHSHKEFHCSGCGYNVLGFKEDLSNFCPNCGCRMVERQESERV